jgi:two-component system cell cycle sensor histidine kinase/response regulator CckA
MKRDDLKVLLVDDDEDDYIITRDLLIELQEPRCDLHWVSSYDDGWEAISSGHFDVCLLDYFLGEHSGLGLLERALSNGCGAPIIVLTGQRSRDIDLQAMKAGAADYLVKSQITIQLLERSIRYAIERKRADKEREDLIAELREAIEKIDLLKGLIPICACCKKIRDDQGYWNQIEVYLREHANAEFSHGICPDCVEGFYPGPQSEVERVGKS